MTSRPPSPGALFRFISLVSEWTGTPTERLSPERARVAMRESVKGPAFVMGRPHPMARVEDATVAGVKVRRYVPPDVRAGTLVYFHGGGWVVGDVDSHDTTTRALAAATQRTVLSVDYRLAPEHRYPAALEDCLSVTREVLRGGERVVVAGDSAGGGLAASVAQAVPVAAQVLIYPVTDCAEERPSYAQFGRGLVLSAETMRYFRAQYVPDEARRREPGCSPLRAVSLTGAPPAYVLLAQCDVLRDEGVAYADRLRAEGSELALDEVPGAVHGFMSLMGLSASKAALLRVARWLELRW